MNKLMEAEDRLIQLHDLLRETGIHRIDVDSIHHALDLLVKKVKRRTDSNRSNVRRSQYISQRLEIFV